MASRQTILDYLPTPEGQAAVASAAAGTGALVKRKNARKPRPVVDLLSRILEPEDFGAIGDGASHTLTSLGYATLTAAQLDYPAATALSDEADWCALRSWIETSGMRVGWAMGQYVVNIPDLAHVIRGQSDQHLYFGRNSKIIINGVWSLPFLAWCEKANVLVDGLRLVPTAAFTSSAVNNSPWTPTQFNATVGPVQVTGQSYRNISGLLSINGTDNITIQNFLIEHATPGRNNNIFMPVSISFHTSGAPSTNVQILNGELNDYLYGIFGYARNLKLKHLRTKRYDQLQVDIWASGHLIYLSNFLYGGMGNSEVEIDDIIDYGEYIGSDTATFTVDTTANTITFDYGTEYPAGQNYAPSNMANGVQVFFMGGKPPAPLVLERAYYVRNYNAATRTFQLSHYGNYSSSAIIDLTSAAGTGCRMGCETATGTIGGRYTHGIRISNVRSFRPHGTLICHNNSGARVSNVTHNSEIFPGALVAGYTNGGVFDSGVPVSNSSMVGRYVRLLTGAGAGQKRRIIQQEGGQYFANAANTFIVETPWTITPSAGDLYEVGNPYIGLPPPVYGVCAFKSLANDDVVLDRVTILGDLGSRGAVAFYGTDPDGVMRAKRLTISNLHLDLDVSRLYGSYPIYVGAEDIEIGARIALRGTWPLAEFGIIGFETGTNGSVDLKFTGLLVASRVEPVAGCNVDLLMRDRRGKPISYYPQGGQMAATAGLRMRTEPRSRELPPIPVTGTTGTLTVPTFDRLEEYGTYDLWLDIHDAAFANHVNVLFKVRYSSGGSSVLKKATDVLSGTAITTADITVSSGVVSGTITMASAATVTLASSWRKVSQQ